MTTKQLNSQLKRMGMRSVSAGAGGGMGSAFVGLNPEGRDWNREAGWRYDNSIVYAAIQYITNGFMEMAPVVRRRKGDGWVAVPNHPAEQLLSDPNPWYDGTTLLSGWIVSELCGRGGQSYTYKHRSAAGKLIGLEYIPHFSVTPFVSPSGNFIDYYWLSVAGAYGTGKTKVEVDDLLVLKHGPLNPRRLYEGYGPLEACLLEVVTDRQAAMFTAALVTNVGITPHFFSPGWKDNDGQPGEVTKEQGDQFLALYDERVTGSQRGKPLLANLPWEVTKLGFSPSEMDVSAIRNTSEERICAALRIHPNVLYLGTGLEQANNRASAGTAEKQSARNCLKPYAERKGQQITRDFRMEGLLGPDEEIHYTHENLEALQEDKTETAKRIVIATGGPYMSVNEGRALAGLEATQNPEDNEVRQKTATATKDNSSAPTDEEA